MVIHSRRRAAAVTSSSERGRHRARMPVAAIASERGRHRHSVAGLRIGTRYTCIGLRYSPYLENGWELRGAP